MGAGQNLIIGESEVIRDLIALIQTYARMDGTVLIQGESGSGKELIARAIHDYSDRRNGPFISVNCASIAESLAESEMFGHERGAFTGAFDRKIGIFEQANHGTLFLDEIGEGSLSIQAKMLRALDTCTVDRVGGRSVPIDIRVVAATNRNLGDEIDAGRFREDLYYRLSMFPIDAPPLRDRREDIPILAEYFAAQLQKAGISPAAVEILTGHHWPGNVRELRNVIYRAAALASAEIIEAGNIRLTSRRTVAQAHTLKSAHDFAIEDALARSGNNCRQAARILNVHPNSVYRYVKQSAVR